MGETYLANPGGGDLSYVNFQSASTQVSEFESLQICLSGKCSNFPKYLLYSIVSLKYFVEKPVVFEKHFVNLSMFMQISSIAGN